jgi:hypothetical protein
LGRRLASRRQGRWDRSGRGVNRIENRLYQFVVVFIFRTVFADLGGYIDLFFFISEIVVVVRGEAQAINHYSGLLLG